MKVIQDAILVLTQICMTYNNLLHSVRIKIIVGNYFSLNLQIKNFPFLKISSLMNNLPSTIQHKSYFQYISCTFFAPKHS
jgi:hypothetical protein